jgi:sterol desaturase/sphingolipid hydroxylase (fatty acid hydroxylase superfamily)
VDDDLHRNQKQRKVIHTVTNIDQSVVMTMSGTDVLRSARSGRTGGGELIRKLALYPFIAVFPGLGILAVLNHSELSVLGVYLAVALAAVFAERALPFIPAPPKDWQTNISYFVSNALVLFAIHAWVTPALNAGRLHVLPTRFWVSALPLAMQVLVALVVVDFCHYFAHRISHGNNVFWRSHRIHHSPEGLYWFNGYRFHWINELFFSSSRIVPLVLLGVPAQVAALVAVIVQTMSLVPHLNVEARSGRVVNTIVNTPELHRWHHLQDPKLSACNFGATTVIWDHVFRTYQRPGVTAEDLLGVPASERVSGGWARHLLSPWRTDNAAIGDGQA